MGLIIGSYALIKGEVSEKLAVRAVASGPAVKKGVASKGHALMPGMDAEEWDFSAKEESENPGRLGIGSAIGLLVSSWAECLGWFGAGLAVLGAFRVRSGPGRVVVASYLVIFGLILVRHASHLGYLSGRHTLSLAFLSVPWAAAGLTGGKSASLGVVTAGSSTREPAEGRVFVGRDRAGLVGAGSARACEPMGVSRGRAVDFTTRGGR